jgi:hypothetical protein
MGDEGEEQHRGAKRAAATKPQPEARAEQRPCPPASCQPIAGGRPDRRHRQHSALEKRKALL